MSMYTGILYVIIMIMVMVVPINGLDQRKMDETPDTGIKCTSCCNNPCNQSPPPPPPPASPPPPPAPKKPPPSSQNCPPPPPPPSYIYITSPPGNLYPVDPYFSGARRSSTAAAVVGCGLMGLLVGFW